VLQSAAPITDAEGMLARIRLIPALGLALTLVGCLMPDRGTPVFVDVRAGDFWSGNGLLTEVSPDQRQCRVSVRDRALIVRDLWVACERVHERGAR
jgi:hypothetical protein